MTESNSVLISPSSSDEAVPAALRIRMANNIACQIHKDWARLNSLNPSSLLVELYSLAMRTVKIDEPIPFGEIDATA